MKKYEYVRIKSTGFMGVQFEDHRTVIDEYAAKGFSYAGYIPAEIDMDGKIRQLDLIFEKDV